MLQIDEYQERVQAVRPVYNTNSPTTHTTTAPSESGIVHITVHLDSSGKEVFFWGDILVVFKNAVNIRHRTRVLPFMRGPDFSVLPLWKRSPEYDPLEIAVTTLKEFDTSPASPRGPHPVRYDTTNYYTTQHSTNVNTPRSPHTRAEDITDIFVMAKQGDAVAQVKLATAYKTGSNGLSQNYESAMDWFLKAATQDHPEAWVQIGMLYEIGLGVVQDFSKAMESYLRSVDQGYAKAQFNLGHMYGQGLGVLQDHSKAVEWYRMAAGQSYASAQSNLGFIVASQVCEQGYSRAKSHLGFLYENDLGFPRDDAMAREWYSRSADQGYAGAQFKLGTIYFNGNGVPQDYAKAMEWYLKEE
ncbi:hypothetical protein BGX33_007398 [Mortierella sp. NVP41]|nr:hypothetical protein BGX33_007398 [Mortierella sp. NVP41]